MESLFKKKKILLYCDLCYQANLFKIDAIEITESVIIFTCKGCECKITKDKSNHILYNTIHDVITE